MLGFETEADAKTGARLIKKAQARSADEKSGAEAPHSKRADANTPCGVRRLDAALFFMGSGATGYLQDSR